MIKILTIVGARPQIIKAAALSRVIKQKFSDNIAEIIVHTGQHYDKNMSGSFFEEMQIPQPKYNLNVGSGSHGVQTSRMITGIEELLEKETPNYIILYGDTNSTLAGSVAAAKIHVPIVHIEAGLRSFNKCMPEELNRIICDHCSTMLFVPTPTGYKNLLNEGFRHTHAPYTIDNPGIFQYGDIMYDNCLHYSKIAAKQSSILTDYNLSIDKFILLTIHRDYNTDNINALSGIAEAINYISSTNNIDIVFPIHPRTRKILNAHTNNSHIKYFLENKRIHLLEPVSFFDMILLEQYARVICTDSGGVQKEAYFYKTPCIILRTETEWVELLDTGMSILTGSSSHKIISAYNTFSDSIQHNYPNIFGDGNTAEKICQELIKTSQ